MECSFGMRENTIPKCSVLPTTNFFLTISKWTLLLRILIKKVHVQKIIQHIYFHDFLRKKKHARHRRLILSHFAFTTRFRNFLRMKTCIYQLLTRNLPGRFHGRIIREKYLFYIYKPLQTFVLSFCHSISSNIC